MAAAVQSFHTLPNKLSGANANADTVAASASAALTRKQHHTALISVNGIGPKTFFNILQHLKINQISWQEFWVNQDQIWAKMRLSKKIASSIKKFKKEHTISSFWQLLQRKNISVITFQDQSYPWLLKQTDAYPPVLFVKGDIKLCAKLPIAVIGTRRMTAYGKMVTTKISQELTAHGAAVVSGFMYGVDVQAQQIALQAGGATVGVLGFGFDHIYPRRHKSIMKQMLQSKQAVFISEYPPDVKPDRGTFPRRNRLIAGLSLAVVVTEAGPKSGTQITVGYALDYGRDVFAVSGPVTSPYHLGVKKMLNQGALLIGSGQEVMANLSARHWGVAKQTTKLVQSQTNQARQIQTHQAQPTEPIQTTQPQKLALTGLQFNPVQKKIMTALRTTTLSTRQLSQQLELDAVEVSTALIALELRGLVKCCAHQWIIVPLSN